jgi:hypothetical protein
MSSVTQNVSSSFRSNTNRVAMAACTPIRAHASMAAGNSRAIGMWITTRSRDRFRRIICLPVIGGILMESVKMPVKVVVCRMQHTTAEPFDPSPLKIGSDDPIPLLFPRKPLLSLLCPEFFWGSQRPLVQVPIQIRVGDMGGSPIFIETGVVPFRSS